MGRDEWVASLEALLLSAAADDADANAVLADEAVELADALAAIATDDDVQAWYLVGMLRWWRYQTLPRERDHDDLAAAVDAFVRVLPHAPQVVPDPVRHVLADHPALNSPTALNDRAVRQLQVPHDVPALDQAIDWLQQAVAATPADHPERPGYLSNLSLALRMRFDRVADAADLDHAIDAGWQAAHATPAGHPDRAAILNNLGTALTTRFQWLADRTDIDQAITVGWLAIDAVADGHPDRAGYQANLGVALQTRFQRTGDLADLDEAIRVGQQAVGATAEDHPDRAGRLSNLGAALRTRFERTGDLADLDHAIHVGRLAVDATPDDHLNRGARLSNLGAALAARFEQTGDLMDLDHGIDAGRQALVATPADHPHRAGRLSNLGGALHTRFERTGELADLDQAITRLQQAVDATPDGHPDRVMYLSNLGTALRTRFEQAGELADLDQAITRLQQAVDATAEDHPDRARYLSNLGLALIVRFQRIHVRADLDQAITRLQQAADAAPADHPHQAAILFNLGTALATRFQRSGDQGDLARAAQAQEQALHTATAPAMTRVQGGRSAAAIAANQGDWVAARTRLAAVLRLLPTLADHGLRPQDRQHHLGQIQGLAGQTARAAIGPLVRDHTWHRRVEAGWLDLERTRTVLLAQTLETRQDIGPLRTVAPALGAEYDQLREVLTGAVPADRVLASEDAAASMRRAEQELIRRRREAATRWPTLLAEIRRVPGFENFALPPPIDSLRAAAGEGTVVSLLVTEQGCGALLLTSDSADYLELDGLTPRTAFDNANAFLRAVDPPQGQPIDPGELTRILGWLWDTVAGPVLDKLGHGPSTVDPTTPRGWPRVWWIPTGPLSVLPIHAAGWHDTRGETVLDRVVSSYTPNVRALADARKATASRPPGTSTLVVGIDQVADLHVPPLTRAEDEARRVHTRLSGAAPVLGSAATRHEVRVRLPDAAWAHFACHGFANNADPAQSHLALYD